MNEWCIYTALYCVLLYTQSALQSWGGGKYTLTKMILLFLKEIISIISTIMLTKFDHKYSKNIYTVKHYYNF